MSARVRLHPDTADQGTIYQTDRHESRRQRRPPRVLLVDDYPDAREMYRVPRVLAFDVVEAENAWKPPARRDTTPDIIPMDLSLPVMDG